MRNTWLLSIILSFATLAAASSNPIHQPEGLAVIDETINGSYDKAGIDSESRYLGNLPRASWDTAVSEQALAGRDPVDINIRWTGTEERFSGVFFPVSGTIHTLIQGTPTEWGSFTSTVAALNGRYLDVEVGYFGAYKRYSAIFFENGDDYSYALRTTNTDAQFQAWLAQYLNEGRSIIDFEAYSEPDGDLKFAGVWIDDPNQPRTVLHYHLESADVSDLLRPLAGRLIDFERYWSPTHGAYRYAVITAMYPNGEWGHYRWLTASELNANHDIIADTNTHITDIESWESAGTVYYAAIWGDGPKSLLEVDAIPGDTSPESLPSTLSSLLSTFESANQGVIGLYAKNMRTDQSLAYRANEPFYLASSAKVAIHIKFWQEVQAGRLNENTLLNYTNCADCRDNWFVDTRTWPGFGPPDFGDDFTLERFDRGMMQVSDNGAASALVDDETNGVSWDFIDLNEWLSGVSGVGRGWWPVTSIHDVDRTIIWQGQVVNFPTDTSYFTIPGWAFEAQWRNGSDTYGDLSDWLGNPATLPNYNGTVGHERYYAMGLNSATPKAFSLLLEGLWEGRFLDADTTRDAVTRMTEGTVFDDLLPADIDVWAKGGVKSGDSHPVSDTAIIELGPDAIALGVLTEDNVRSVATIRASFMAPIALEVVRALTADLLPDPSGNSFSPTTLFAGETLAVYTDILNDGGGECATAFDVTFYASVNTNITVIDYPIATVRVSPIAPGSGSLALSVAAFPDTIPPRTYYVGWIVDSSGDSPFYEVGEFDEDNNAGVITGYQLTVLDDAYIFADDFEMGNTGAWSAVVVQP
ncbi:MAG: hypothetical protein DRJ65_02195 [Acidobacteria bacterium]|nr:MAG: hypothetical protein DRJ65_02195 [Acidobacteriota bacterium]